MNFGSLFSGIGGLDLAMEAYGHNAVWQVEMDPFCNSILETHWPDVQRFTDIRDIDWATVTRPELLCGGFPCQPFSVAGQNRGADDDRNLWPETIRAVRELGPRYVFLENVPGLLAHEYFGTILRDLAEGGYDAVWDTFTAAEVGAPHRRERLFILAYRTLADARQQQEYIQQRRTRGEPAGGGDSVADADVRRHGQQAEGLRPGGSTDLTGSDLVGYPERQLRQGRAEPTGRTGQALPGRSSPTMADAEGSDGRSRKPGIERTTGLRRRGPGSDDEGGGQLSEPERGSQGRNGPEPIDSFPPGPDERDAWARLLAQMPALEPAVCRVATRVPDRTHRLKALGNAVVAAQGLYAFQVLWGRMLDEQHSKAERP